MYQNYIMCVSEPSIRKNKALKCSNFVTFFVIRLIRGSTYSRVYTVIVWNLSTFEYMLKQGSQTLTDSGAAIKMVKKLYSTKKIKEMIRNVMIIL
jgi:hypothetical protein